jgi:hypothetical protein
MEKSDSKETGCKIKETAGSSDSEVDHMGFGHKRCNASSNLLLEHSGTADQRY